MIDTNFAPAERASEDVVWSQYEKFSSNPVLNNLLCKIDQYIIVLNSHRQIVYANKSFLTDFGFGAVGQILGKRVGEILDCRYAWCVSGCGTSEFCKDCGAVRSMLESQQGSDNLKECIILTKTSKTLELGVTSKHIDVAGEPYTIFSITDLSERRSIKALEDIFYHDILNLANSMHSMIHLLHDERILDKRKIQAQLASSSDALMNELQSHKILKSAEKMELVSVKEPLNSLETISQAVRFIERMQTSRGNILYVHHSSAEFEFESDPSLLNRVLVNMLTNALEASAFSEKVTIGCELRDEEKVFWVHNQAYIHPEIQSKIFRETFSTKKNGSGFGTQSIRVITETYLDGRVSFESFADTGTTFSVYLK